MKTSGEGQAKRMGCARLAGRVTLGLGLLLAALLATGAGYQAASSAVEARQLPPPGMLVDIGGRRLHLYCTGAGSPAVILEGGAAEWSIHWQAVQPQVTGFTRVCSYDRAGYGWSDPAPRPVSAGRVVDDLHTLLQTAGEGGPYVLAGHSQWGPAVRLFAGRYPGEVAGVVLVETLHESLFSPTPEAFKQSMSLFQAMRVLAPFGIVRLLARTGIVPVDDLLYTNKLPEAQRPAYRAAYSRAQFWATAYAEYAGLPQTVEDMRNVGDLGDLPLMVIRAGDRPADDWPPEAEWRQVQALLAGLSTQGVELVAEASGHYVQLDQPEIVVEAIRRVVEAGR